MFWHLGKLDRPGSLFDVSWTKSAFYMTSRSFLRNKFRIPIYLSKLEFGISIEISIETIFRYFYPLLLKKTFLRNGFQEKESKVSADLHGFISNRVRILNNAAFHCYSTKNITRSVKND